MSNYPHGLPDADEDGRPQPRPASLFEDAQPTPPVERRRYVDPPDERARLDSIGPRIAYKPGLITRAMAAEFTDLHARQTLRRELVALRARIEGWARDRAGMFSWDDSWDPDEDDMIRSWREMVVVLDERISAVGGVEREPGKVTP